MNQNMSNQSCSMNYTTKGSFKKLIRNLRKKNHEKLHIRRNSDTVIDREKGKESDIRSQKKSNTGN